MRTEKNFFNTSVKLKNEHYVRTFIINDRVDGFKSYYSTCIIMAHPIKRADLIRKQRVRKKIMGL